MFPGVCERARPALSRLRGPSGKKRRAGGARLGLAVALLCLLASDAWAAKIRIKVHAPDGREQRVFLTRPRNLSPDRPVVFVMHGVERNASEYRDQWHALAEEHDFLLVVPEFSDRLYPGAESYNLGGMFDASGAPRPPAAWAYSTIEPIFDEVSRRYGMRGPGYAIYGHSAGAQFVHRFLYFVSGARVSSAVAANAGWYTMPEFGTAFPYGLRGSGLGPADLERALGAPLTVLLGESDTDPEDPNLRRTPEALLQGANRYSRGQAFFATAREAADALGAPLRWRLATVPGAGHDNRLMAPEAIPYLLP